jgi:hypothetical protein
MTIMLVNSRRERQRKRRKSIGSREAHRRECFLSNVRGKSVTRKRYVILFVSALRRRPVSPDRLPGTADYTEEDKLYSPVLKGKTPNYKHSLIIGDFGPCDQHALYKTAKDKKERSSDFLRVGLPAFFFRLLEKAQRSMPGVKTPSFHSDLTGRLALMSSLYKVTNSGQLSSSSFGF